LFGGQLQVLFGSAPGTVEYVKSSKVHALAVTSATRWEGLPELPCVNEFVPDFEASSWYGVGAPKNTPSDIVEKLNKAINEALADAKMKARLADLGGMIMGGSPADFGKIIAQETEKWANVIRAANIKPE
jgi:tripartite-type tricarboxylate transporter receptor subunit TctC